MAITYGIVGQPHLEQIEGPRAELDLGGADEVGRDTGDFQCRERLGGLLRYCYWKAA